MARKLVDAFLSVAYETCSSAQPDSLLVSSRTLLLLRRRSVFQKPLPDLVGRHGAGGGRRWGKEIGQDRRIYSRWRCDGVVWLGRVKIVWLQ